MNNFGNFADWKLDDLATLLVGALFGWTNDTEIEEPEATGSTLLEHFFSCSPEDLTRDQLRQVANGLGIKRCWQMNKADLCRAIDDHTPVEVDPDDFGMTETKDNEVEHFVPSLVEVANNHLKQVWFPTWAFSDNSDCYFTTTGDNPVIKDQAALADEVMSAAGFMPEEIHLELEGPVADHYTWPAHATFNGAKRRERHFHAWVGWIWRNQQEPARLQDGWKSFWKKYFARKKAGTTMEWLTATQVATIRRTFEKLGVKSRQASI